LTIYFERTFQRSFGTWPLRGAVLADAMQAALAVGYRSFDTAQGYGNEAEVGAVLAESGVPRGELCMTTKVRPENFGADRFIRSVEQSLTDLAVDQVDVLLLHWPPVGGDVVPGLRLLSEAYKRGLARNVGVSNYTVAMLKQAVAVVEAPIVTNQVEYHPLLDQSRLMAGAVALGVPLASYCSVARGEVFKYPVFAEIGAGYGKSAAQVVLRWILQKGVSLNTMSTNPVNIAANFDIMDFSLSAVDMARIDALTATGLRLIGKEQVANAPDWD
jgi:2,5-diketo-D-gluconate reductase B